MNYLQRKKIRVEIPPADKSDKKNYQRTNMIYDGYDRLAYLVADLNVWGVNRYLKRTMKLAHPQDQMQRAFKRVLDYPGGRADKIIKLLVKHGFTPDFSDSNVFYKISRNTPETIDFLCNTCGFAVDDDYYQLFSFANKDGNEELKLYLLNSGNINLSGSAMADSFITHTPADFIQRNVELLQDCGFKLSDHAIKLLLKGFNKDDVEFCRYVYHRCDELDWSETNFLHVYKVAKYKKAFFGFYEELNIKGRDHDMIEALKYIHRQDTDGLSQALIEQGRDINEDNSLLMRLAVMEGPGRMLQKLYDMGGTLSAVKTLSEKHIYRGLESGSESFVQEMINRPEAEPVFMSFLAETNHPYPRKAYHTAYKAWVDKHGAAKAGELFISAVKSHNNHAVTNMLQSGFDINALSYGDIRVICACTDADCLDPTLVAGLDLKPHALRLQKDLSSRDLNWKMREILQKAVIQAQNDEYPYWERHDDNTVAEVSLHRRTAKKVYQIRRAFNFRAGVMDSFHEILEENKLVETTPVSPVPFDHLNKNIINRARDELVRLGGKVPYDHAVSQPNVLSRKELRR